MSHYLKFQFLGSVSAFPPIPQAIRDGGPIVHALVALFLASFLHGLYRAWRKPGFTPLNFISIYAPTILGGALGILQSYLAEMNINNLGGMLEWSRPDRYVGHIRIYLSVGILTSATLFLVQIMAARRRRLDSTP